MLVNQRLMNTTERYASPITVAVSELSSYNEQTGIGRVVHRLERHWQGSMHLTQAQFEVRNLPLIRNLPYGVAFPDNADLVLLPKITGAVALRRPLKVPSVVIVHDIGVVDFPSERAAAGWLTQKIIEQSFYSLPQASWVVTVSDFTRRRLLRYLPQLAERVSIIPNGVDDFFLTYTVSREAAREQLQRVLGKSLEGPLLVYVGSEIPRKDFSVLLQVLKSLKADYPALRLLKVGAAGHPRWRAATLTELSRLGLRLNEDLVLCEGIDDQLLAAAYRAADVFLSASRYEGFGLPALEAMAIGTPVVVRGDTALSEVVGTTSSVVNGSVKSFVQATADLLSNSIGQEGVSHTKVRAASFSWAHSAEAYLTLFRNLCAS